MNSKRIGRVHDGGRAGDGAEVVVMRVPVESALAGSRLVLAPRRWFETNLSGRLFGLVGPHVEVVPADNVLGRFEGAGWESTAVARSPFTERPRPTHFKGMPAFRHAQGAPMASNVALLGVDGEPATFAGLEHWRTQAGASTSAQLTVFHAANTVIDAARSWAGRPLSSLGEGGRLKIVVSGVTDDSSFYIPDAGRFVLTSVMRFQEDGIRKVFQVANSWEVGGHEVMHAITDALAPEHFDSLATPDGLTEEQSNAFAQEIWLNSAYWLESFATHNMMWASVMYPERLEVLLDQIGPDGDLTRENVLTSLGGEFMNRVYNPAGDPARAAQLRAQMDLMGTDKLSEVDQSVPHIPAGVLNRALFEVMRADFQERLGEGPHTRAALREALLASANLMGTLCTRALDYLPRQRFSLQDVCRALLTTDALFNDGEHRARLIDAMKTRELITDSDVTKWREHRAAVPDQLVRPTDWTPQTAVEDLSRWVSQHREALGVPEGFGVTVAGLEVTTDDPAATRWIVRLQVTDGEQPGAPRLANAGIVVFGPDGHLEEAHSPWPAGLSAPRARELLQQARAEGLDASGELFLFPFTGADGEDRSFVGMKLPRGVTPPPAVFGPPPGPAAVADAGDADTADTTDTLALESTAAGALPVRVSDSRQYLDGLMSRWRASLHTSASAGPEAD